jgi:hypothetical protein
MIDRIIIKFSSRKIFKRINVDGNKTMFKKVDIKKKKKEIQKLSEK